MKPRRLAVIVGLLLCLYSTDVLADEVKPLPGPHVIVTSGDATITTIKQEKYLLPVGSHVLDGTSYEKLDEKLKEQENLATRYKAENESLKKSLQSQGPGWGTLIVLTGLAIATGTVVYFTN